MTAPDLSHAKYDQLAAGFALSALEPEDEVAFRSHLPGCARCAEALLEHSTTMGHLAFAASSEEPPASVLEEAPASLDAARARRTVRLSTALVGVAASLIVALGLVFVSGGFSNKGGSSENVAFERILQQQLVPGARSVSLSGEGRAVAVLNGGKVSLVVSGMPVNDASRSIYVLWGKSRYGGVRAVGAFDVTSTTALAITNLGTVTPGTLQLLMVTREQGRRAPAVTTQQPILAGQV